MTSEDLYSMKIIIETDLTLVALEIQNAIENPPSEEAHRSVVPHLPQPPDLYVHSKSNLNKHKKTNPIDPPCVTPTPLKKDPTSNLRETLPLQDLPKLSLRPDIAPALLLQTSNSTPLSKLALSLRGIALHHNPPRNPKMRTLSPPV